MAGSIKDNVSGDAKVQFCRNISMYLQMMKQNTDFILEYKVMCASIRHKYYAYVYVKVRTAPYMMSILSTGNKIEDLVSTYIIPPDIGLSGYEFKIESVD